MLRDYGGKRQWRTAKRLCDFDKDIVACADVSSHVRRGTYSWRRTAGDATVSLTIARHSYPQVRILCVKKGHRSAIVRNANNTLDLLDVATEYAQIAMIVYCAN